MSTPGCSVHQRDIMSTVGRYHKCTGGSTLGTYHDECGVYHEYTGGCSVHWGIR